MLWDIGKLKKEKNALGLSKIVVKKILKPSTMHNKQALHEIREQAK